MTEQRLRDSERFHRTLMEDLTDFVARFDTNLCHTYVNPAILKSFGQPARFFLGRTICELPLPGNPEQNRQLLDATRETVETGMPNVREAVWPTPEGEGTFEVRYIPELDDEGKVVGVLGIARNITGRKRNPTMPVVPTPGLDGTGNGALAIGQGITVSKVEEPYFEESNAQLRELAARRETACEEERKRIAREIHDELGQYLTAIRLEGSLLRLQFGKDNPLLLGRIQRLMVLVDDLTGAVRNLATALRPAALDVGIGPALEWLAEEFTEHTGVPCLVKVEGGSITLDDAGATALFRVAQESLTNIARHAGASEVSVVLTRVDGHYLLQIRDDGQGFDPAAIRPGALGLLGMKERILLLGDQLKINSIPSRGTVIEVRVPIHEPGDPLPL
ncbi:two-component system, NarL family, sensor histidine kinase UhpB [Gammaproteobacteria bacterium]